MAVYDTSIFMPLWPILTVRGAIQKYLVLKQSWPLFMGYFSQSETYAKKKWLGHFF